MPGVQPFASAKCQGDSFGAEMGADLSGDQAAGLRAELAGGLLILGCIKVG